MEILNIFQALDVDQSSKFTAAPGRSRPWHSIDHRFINISLSRRRLPCWVIDTPSAVDKMKQNGKGLIKLPVHIYSIIYIMHHNATYSVALRKVDSILFGHSAGRRFFPNIACARYNNLSLFFLDLTKEWHIRYPFKRGILSHETHKDKDTVSLYLSSFIVDIYLEQWQVPALKPHLNGLQGLLQPDLAGKMKSSDWQILPRLSHVTFLTWKHRPGLGPEPARESVGLPGPTVLCRCAFWALLTEWMCREVASQRSVPKSLRTSPLVKNSSTRRTFQSVHRSSDPCAIKGWFPTGYTPWEFLEHPCIATWQRMTFGLKQPYDSRCLLQVSIDRTSHLILSAVRRLQTSWTDAWKISPTNSWSRNHINMLSWSSTLSAVDSI